MKKLKSEQRNSVLVGKRGEQCREERESKHRRDGGVCNGERKQLQSCVWVCRRVHGRASGVYMRGGAVGKSKRGSGSERVQLGARKRFVVKEETSFAREIHRVSAQVRGRREKGGLRWRRQRLNC